MFQVFKRLRCPRNNSHFNTNSPPSSYRAWREISFQHTIYTWFKLLHTWRKLYQSNKVGDNLELPSHLIAGKSSPFLGRWRFLSPLRAALIFRYSEHHNNFACGMMMVSYRFFGCDLTGYCWYSCICPYRTCLFHDLHYLSFTHTTWTIKKSTLFEFGLDWSAFFFILDLAPKSSCKSHVYSRHS